MTINFRNPVKNGSPPPPHTFTRSEIKEAAHLMRSYIEKYIGELWELKSDSQYLGVSWDCESPLTFDQGLWTLCQSARQRGAKRGAGRIDAVNVATILRFTLIYDFAGIIPSGTIEEIK